MDSSEKFLKHTLPELTRVFNLISLAASFTVVVTVIGLGLYNKKKIDRVGFRLQGAVAAIDTIRHILFLVLDRSESSLCPTIGFLNSLLGKLYALINVMMALNLQLMLLNNRYPKPKWEYYYWGVPILSATALTLPFVDIFGATPQGLCLVKEVYATSTWFHIETILYSIIIVGCIVYSSAVPVLILGKLYIAPNSFWKLQRHLTTTNDQSQRTLFQATFIKLILRSMVYPLACFLSLIGSAVQIFSGHVLGQFNPWAVALMFISLSLTGTFNLIAFLFDPTLHRALKYLRQDYVRRAQNRSSTLTATSLSSTSLSVAVPSNEMIALTSGKQLIPHHLTSPSTSSRPQLLTMTQAKGLLLKFL